MANIYKRFSPDDIVPLKKKRTQSVFTGNVSTLTTFFTGSQASETGSRGRALYHLNVFNTGSNLPSAAVQFATAYGHFSGYGTPLVTVDSGSTRPTQAVYKQYANTLLPKDQQKFKFYSSSTPDAHESDDIFVLNFSRARIREALDIDSFEIHLQGSNGTFKFIDESADVTNPAIGPGGVVYNLASGSIDLTTPGSDIVSYTASNGEGYGKIYPESGVVVFNPSAIADTIGTVNGVTISGATGNTSAGTYDNLHFDFYNAISDGGFLKARSAENLSSENYFVRVRNKEFNFSNNPTFVTGSEKQIINDLYNEPVSYIASIGLYNDSNELLAVAKLSTPTENTRDTETLVKIKLDF